MTQKWHDLLFMHWRVDPNLIRRLIPAGLDLNTYDGSAWVGVVPFRMSGVRPRWTPPIPGVSALPELNVRTYVTTDGKPGVWFFSLDAGSALAVAAARRFFYLPYFRAQFPINKSSDGMIDYRSRRTHRNASAAELRMSYKPIGAIFHAQSGTIEYFLTERYCLYAFDGRRIFRCEIDHAPWPLQPAEAQVKVNTMAAASAILLPNEKPLLHFARYQDVKIWGLKEAAQES
ncbi:MAG: YqjF family protein [Candidatus Acidiferrales bacterium]